MAYVTTNPPVRVAGAIAGPSIWMYSHATDNSATVLAQDYFTNGLALGMKVGDLVFHHEVDALLGTWHSVETVDGDGTLLKLTRD